MEKKTYRYFVSFAAYTNGEYTFGNVVLVYDEPMNTQDMLDRASRDIFNELKDPLAGVAILFFKRIKGNR